MMKKVFGLEDWELDKTVPNRNRQVDIAVDLKWLDAEQVIAYSPSRRVELRAKDLVSKFNTLVTSGLIGDYELDSPPEKPSRIKATVPYSILSRLRKLDYVEHIWIKKISDAKKIKQKPVPKFYCVRMTVAIQIEGMKKGRQTIEDRFVLVKARSFEDAYDKIEKQKGEYESPYLNSDGALVRWKIESLDDCYETYIGDPTDLNDKEGVEVFSKLRYRQMKKEHIWDGKSDEPIKIK